VEPLHQKHENEMELYKKSCVVCRAPVSICYFSKQRLVKVY